ncbi:MAG: SCO family protein [Vicinamibacterales bacterium]
MKTRAVAVMACLAGALAGCTREPEVRTYHLSGQILVVRSETQEILIRHGDIAGFMPGMTMPFKVRDGALLEGREVGDLVEATLSVTAESAWLSALTATGRAPLPPDAPAAIPAAAGVSVLVPGDRVPDTALVTASGRALRLTEASGRATAVTFIYTRCPLPDFCPLMDRRFAEVQRRASADSALAGRVSLVSVSFDPAADTAARLTSHAEALGANPSIWQFATIADAAQVDRFAATFGVNVIREQDGTITHNLRTLVIAPSGTVVSARDGNQWAADDLLADLRAALGR